MQKIQNYVYECVSGTLSKKVECKKDMKSSIFVLSDKKNCFITKLMKENLKCSNMSTFYYTVLYTKYLNIKIITLIQRQHTSITSNGSIHKHKHDNGQKS